MGTLSEALKYLNTHHVLSLATVQENLPWVAPVFYVVYDTGLVFLSAPHTRHSKNIASNPDVSASIQQDYSDWKDIKGIQLEGTVSVVADEDKSKVIDCYSRKFPVAGADAPAEIVRALDKVWWYEIRVGRLLYIDNSKGFGCREEVDCDELFSSGRESAR